MPRRGYKAEYGGKSQKPRYDSTAIIFQNGNLDATCEKHHTPLCPAITIAAEGYVSSCYVVRFSCSGIGGLGGLNLEDITFFFLSSTQAWLIECSQGYKSVAFLCKIDLDSFSSQFISTLPLECPFNRL